MCESTSKFVMSQRIQEILCMLGQAVVFEEGSEILEESSVVVFIPYVMLELQEAFTVW